jgi:hypothetical protein
MADHCRSCETPIEWAITIKGARIPLDLGDHDDGNLRLEDGIAIITTIRPARRTHFQSCPDAARFRRKATR